MPGPAVPEPVSGKRGADPISPPGLGRVLLPLHEKGKITCAPLAQSAERLHGKEKVYGSIP